VFLDTVKGEFAVVTSSAPPVGFRARRPMAHLSVVLGVIALLVACSTGDAAGPSTTDSPAITRPVATTTTLAATTSLETTTTGFPDAELQPVPPPVASQADLVSQLAFAPNRPGHANVVVHDHAFQREAVGMGPYDGPLDQGSVLEYLSDTGFLDVWHLATNERLLADVAAWRDDLGFAPIDVQQLVAVSNVLRPLWIARTTRSIEQIDAAVTTNEQWSGELTVTTEGEATVYAWGEDYMGDLRRSSPGRLQGVGGQLAVVDDLVIRTHGRQELDPALAAIAGAEPSLADSPEIAETVGVLQEQGAAWIVGSLEIAGVRQWRSEEAEGEYTYVWPYEFVAVGNAFPGGEAQGLLAFHYSDPLTADESAGRLLNMILTTEDRMGRAVIDEVGPPMVGVEGTIVVARFTDMQRPDSLLQLLQLQAPLFYAS
jgi:hypothetical protein